MLYIYGVDLAENLNYFAVWILYPKDGHIRIKTVKKAKNVLYPTLEKMFTDPKIGLFKKYPPAEIWTNYTNEKAFSEYLETHFHPAFANPHSKDYKKWKMVHPIVSTQPVNLNMKQNAAQMMQADENGFKVFEWPDPKRTRAETGIIIAEAKEQTLREAAHVSSAGMAKSTFPKPTGYDNDLIRGLELMLLGARKYANSISNLSDGVTVIGARVKPPEPPTIRDMWKREIIRRTSHLNVTNIDIKLSTD